MLKKSNKHTLPYSIHSYHPVGYTLITQAIVHRDKLRVPWLLTLAFGGPPLPKQQH